jgi:hypothetical protein
MRGQVEALFQERVSLSATQGLDAEIVRHVERLIRELGREIGRVDRHEYLAAQDFLRGLKHECELGPQIN